MEILKRLQTEDIVEIQAIMQQREQVIVDVRTYKDVKIGKIEGQYQLLDAKGSIPTSTPEIEKIKLLSLVFRSGKKMMGTMIKVNRDNNKQFSVHPVIFVTDNLYLTSSKSKPIEFKDLEAALNAEVDMGTFKEDKKVLEALKKIPVTEELLVDIKGRMVFSKGVSNTLVKKLKVPGNTLLSFLENINEIYLTHSLHTSIKLLTATIEGILDVVNIKIIEQNRQSQLMNLVGVVAGMALNAKDPRARALQVTDLDKLDKVLKAYDI